LLSLAVDRGEVTLDAIGQAVGAEAITPPEIEAIFEALEKANCRVVSPENAEGEARLRAVVTSLRSLHVELGRRPRLAEIAAHAGLTEDAVRHALALAKVMQR